MKLTKIMVTGGSGMVGRNLVDHPEAKNFQFLAPSHGELDLRDAAAVERYMIAAAPDVIIHAAGVVGGIQANIDAPVKFLAENAQMGMAVILGARSAGVKALLNLGSSCMYPRAAENPLREESVMSGELEPTNEGYALAKITCARLCEYIAREDGEFIYRTVIPCNLYGPHDKFDPHHSHMIPAVIRKISDALDRGEEAVEIWGDGKARREFMYVGDLIDFIFFALRNLNALPQNINVGVGGDLAVLEYYEAIAEVLGFRGSFVHDFTKPSGMSQKLVSIEKLDALGWKAKTSLRAGIKKTSEFYRSGKIK